MPLPNGNPTAAELDRAMKGEAVYNEAIALGLSEDEALTKAREFMKDYAATQFLRSLGVDPCPQK